MTTTSTPVPPTIDPVAAERWRLHAPAQSPWLHDEIGQRMEDRLQWIKRQPESWADWTPLRGGQAAQARVLARYPQAAAVLVEQTESGRAVLRDRLVPDLPWWRRLPTAGKRVAAPRIVDGSEGLQVDLVWSNMQLHMAARPQALIQQWCDSLVPDGFLMFSCLGPDTVRELRALYARLGWPVAGHELTDMHDWGDMLVQAGFAEPVMDMERIVLTYDTPERLLAELRELGRNLHPARFAGLRGRQWRERLLAALSEGLTRTEDGRLALTFEVVYGHAFKAPPRVPLAGTSSIKLDDMRSLLKAGQKPVR